MNKPTKHGKTSTTCRPYVRAVILDTPGFTSSMTLSSCFQSS
ncbi:unnamed protein product [Acanthoscelides obtectus]|uniref:Uncharacterized protein n=1 Tax=Acanthoscelides obtectus TaxID=200917 RepID=A0A9P0K298_ACAOB|nr:unnamed protein product [Acanthoscelides obtectus]CAK1639049.1 hypothetical protein AOBTE_LOCUS10973 [Acanthoscelides obtectus]